MNIPKRIKISRIEKDILNAILELMVVESLGRILRNSIMGRDVYLKPQDVESLSLALNRSIKRAQKILSGVGEVVGI